MYKSNGFLFFDNGDFIAINKIASCKQINTFDWSQKSTFIIDFESEYGKNLYSLSFDTKEDRQNFLDKLTRLCGTYSN